MKLHTTLMAAAAIVSALFGAVPGVAVAAGGAAASGATVCGAGDEEATNINPVKQMLNVLQISGRLLAFLESHSAQAALVARAGSDQAAERFRDPAQQKFTHVGLVVKTPEQDWTFVHLLNTCAGANSDIYLQKVANFFTDGPHF